MFDGPFEDLLNAPRTTPVGGDAAEMIEADRRERERIARKRAANPRYDPKIHGG